MRLVDDHARHPRLLQAQSARSCRRFLRAWPRARRLLFDRKQRTLEELVDFDLVNRCRPRLTVGAAHVRTSQMRYFDSRDCALSVSHVLASGALPPAFPAVRIGGE